jgi:hypothetical protein
MTAFSRQKESLSYRFSCFFPLANSREASPPARRGPRYFYEVRLVTLYKNFGILEAGYPLLRDDHSAIRESQP